MQSEVPRTLVWRGSKAHLRQARQAVPGEKYPMEIFPSDSFDSAGECGGRRAGRNIRRLSYLGIGSKTESNDNERHEASSREPKFAQEAA
jgi:hypothetical protein